MVRGIDRGRIFFTEDDRVDLLDRLGLLAPKLGSRVYAWSLMPNHFHLLVRTGQGRISTVMRRLLTGYAGAFNRRHRRCGHLFQNRYKSILVEEESYFLELVRYLHLNPLRAGLVRDLEELDGYRWSGHAVLMGNLAAEWQDCEFVLAQFGPEVGVAQEAYWRFVAEGLSQGRRPELVGGGMFRSLGGKEKIAELKRSKVRLRFDERVLGS